MDNIDRRQRQNPSGYASQAQGTLLQPQAQYPVVSASDRFRQAIGQPPTSAPSGSRAGSQSYGYAYDQGSQFVGSAIQPSYGAQDYSSDQQPQRGPQYSGYGQNVAYNVPGAQASTASQSQYEPVQPYQQPRDSAIEVLGTGFGGVAQPQYYGVPAQEGPTSAPPAANGPAQYAQLGYPHQVNGVNGNGREPPSYTAAGMTEPHQAPSQGGYPQNGYGEQAEAGNEHERHFREFNQELKKVNQSTKDGQLAEAAAALLRISEWLMRVADGTGLTRDDENLYPQRLQLWNDFNNCWLVTLQKQKDMTDEMIMTGQRPQPPQNIIEYADLEKMGDQVVKWCDGLEKHGLVDYEMGFAEETITAMILVCLELCESADKAGSSSSQRPLALSANRRR